MKAKIIPRLSETRYVEVIREFPPNPHYIMEVLNTAYMAVPEEYRESASMLDITWCYGNVTVEIGYTWQESDAECKKRVAALKRAKRAKLKKKPAAKKRAKK